MTKVLIVDDEPGVLQSTKLLLVDLGLDVVTTSNALEVVATLKRERPDVLLQDVRMPDLDLERLVRSIRADPDVASTPIVLFSASMDLEAVRDRVGADGVLEKPFKPEEILQIVQGVMATPAAR